MKISDRFTDYGITGAFFLMGQLILLVFWGQVGWIDALGNFMHSIPSILQSSALGLLVVLAIIGIFFFGVLLDVVGSLGKQEWTSFQAYMLWNQGWFQPLLEENPTYFPPTCINAAFQPPPTAHILRKLWRFFWHLFIPFLLGKPLQTYIRLRDFSFSLVLLNETVPLDALSDCMHLWRTTRALFATALVWTYEVFLLLLLGPLERLSAVHILPTPSSGFLLWNLLALVFILVAARAMALSAYNRMCSILFPLLYLTDKKNRSNGSPD